MTPTRPQLSLVSTERATRAHPAADPVEQQLRDMQSLMGMAVQIGRLGAWAWAVGDATLSCSRELAAVLEMRPGYAPSPAQALAAFAPEYQPRVGAILKSCLDSGSPFDIEAEMLTGRGRRVWVRVLCEAEWDDLGRVTRLHGAMQDITPGKLAEAQLRESQRMLSGLLTNLPGMVYRCANAQEWPLLFASPGALQLTGYTPQELMAHAPHYGTLIHEEDRQAVWDGVQRALADHGQFQLTYRLNTRDGLKWVLEQGSGVYEADGSLRCVEGLVTDITANKRAELEVARLNEHLEERVRQRTGELQMANAELEAFAYSIAHDLRAPMTALDGFTRLLERNLRDVGTQNAHYIRRILGNVRHMSDLTDALLALARLSAVELVLEEVDLADMAARAMEQLREIEPDRVVQLSMPARLPARGDPRLLQQVMSNLLGNAWKFSRTRPRTRIALAATQPPDGGPTVYSVADEGVGFDMAHAQNLFSAFHRMHSVGEFEGTGIGLALVRKIVTRHGGRVWAQSTPGTGTTLYFTLGA